MPSVIYLASEVDKNGQPIPILMFGAGYDPQNDEPLSEVSESTQGRGIYLVNAETGELLWSATRNSDEHLTHPDLRHSVPMTPLAVDANTDNLTDRIYFGDVGGQLWRADLIGQPSNWTLVKIASLGSQTDATKNRRFFSTPSMTHTFLPGTQVPVDMLTIGSGNRAKLKSDLLTEDRLFVINDLRILSRALKQEDVTPLTNDDFLLISESSDEIPANDGSKKGWSFDPSSAGEKFLNEAIVVDGKLLFNSFVANQNLDVNEQECSVSGSIGRAFEYQFPLFINQNSQLTKSEKENAIPTESKVCDCREDSSETELTVVSHGSESIDISGGIFPAVKPFNNQPESGNPLGKRQTFIRTGTD
jgi:type IV pilus assembly protein PilY1